MAIDRLINDTKEFKRDLMMDINKFGVNNGLEEEELDLLSFIAEGFVKFYDKYVDAGKKDVDDLYTDKEILEIYFDNLENVFGTHHNFDKLPMIINIIERAESIEMKQERQIDKAISDFNKKVAQARDYSSYTSSGSSSGSSGCGSSSGSSRSSSC